MQYYCYAVPNAVTVIVAVILSSFYHECVQNIQFFVDRHTIRDYVSYSHIKSIGHRVPVGFVDTYCLNFHDRKPVVFRYDVRKYDTVSFYVSKYVTGFVAVAHQ